MFRERVPRDSNNTMQYPSIKKPGLANHRNLPNHAGMLPRKAQREAAASSETFGQAITFSHSYLKLRDSEVGSDTAGLGRGKGGGRSSKKGGNGELHHGGDLVELLRS